MDYQSIPFINKSRYKLNKLKISIKKRKMETKSIIIGIVIGLVIGILAGYFLNNIINPIRGPGNFQINENTKNEITAFFESTTDTNEINSYCEQNRMNCMYYCRSINPNNEICSQITNQTRGFPRQ
jgi:hypothetical protein